MKYPVPASFNRRFASKALEMLEAGQFATNLDEWGEHPLTSAFTFSQTELGFDWWDEVLEARRPADEAIEILKEWIAAT